MEADLRRLVAAAESLELQVRELRAEIRELVDGVDAAPARGPAAASGRVRVQEAPTSIGTEHPPPTLVAAPSEPAEPESVEPVPFEPAAPSAHSAGGASGDSEGARLIALSMALDGKPRAEAERYLREHFGLEDCEAILDDAYAAGA